MHSDLLQMNAMRARFYVNEPINVNGNDVQWFEINLVEMHNDEHDYAGFKYSIACMNKLGSYVNVITGEPDSDGNDSILCNGIMLNDAYDDGNHIATAIIQAFEKYDGVQAVAFMPVFNGIQYLKYDNMEY